MDVEKAGDVDAGLLEEALLPGDRIGRPIELRAPVGNGDRLRTGADQWRHEQQSRGRRTYHSPRKRHRFSSRTAPGRSPLVSARATTGAAGNVLEPRHADRARQKVPCPLQFVSATCRGRQIAAWAISATVLAPSAITIASNSTIAWPLLTTFAVTLERSVRLLADARGDGCALCCRRESTGRARRSAPRPDWRAAGSGRDVPALRCGRSDRFRGLRRDSAKAGRGRSSTAQCRALAPARARPRSPAAARRGRTRRQRVDHRRRPAVRWHECVTGGAALAGALDAERKAAVLRARGHARATAPS